jgi:hypothetical protein
LSNARNLFVLIHSPLVGPLTWRLIADELRQRGREVLLPELEDSPDSKKTYWKQHAGSVSKTLAQISQDIPLTLIAHSGAGPLLPVIRQSLVQPIHAYVFVDAGIPRNGLSRLDLMKSEDPAWAEQFKTELDQGGRFPTWSSDDLAGMIPDTSLREQMVAEIHPRGLDFFTEPIPVFEGWPDAPCVYIQLSAAYRQPAAIARREGWQTYRLEAGHFHMLVDPNAVTDLVVKGV